MPDHPSETISTTPVREVIPGVSFLIGCFPSSVVHCLKSWTLNHRISEMPKPLERRLFPHFESWGPG